MSISWDDLLIVAIGMVLSWAGFYFSLLAVIQRRYDEWACPVPVGVSVAAALFAFVGPVLWTIFMSRFYRRRRRKRRRMVRLSRIKDRHDAAERLPLRLAEFALRTDSPSSKRFASCFKRVAAGRIIFVNWGSRV